MLFASRLWARSIAYKRAQADYLLIVLSIETSSLFVLIAIINEVNSYARFDEAAFELLMKSKCGYEVCTRRFLGDTAQKVNNGILSTTQYA